MIILTAADFEKTAADAFLEELAIIARDSTDDGTKTAAAGLYEQLNKGNVVDFLKQAGFGTMLGGVAKGVGALGMGALRGAGSAIGGTVRGVGGAIGNAASSAGNAVRGAATSAIGSLKAAPGALGAKMDSLGQRAQAGMTGLGQRLQAAGEARGQAIQGRLAGPSAPAAPAASSANVQSGPYKPPMMSMGQQIAESNPFHGMGSSIASNVRNLAANVGWKNPAQQQQQPRGASYGALAPAM
jgi:hypothetical protein